jgi:metal-responsive CopG/Arc/MetJ family transcriptional regulator
MLYNAFMVKKLTAVRIKERDLEELERVAMKEDETVSSLIRQAIREFLDRYRTKGGR